MKTITFILCLLMLPLSARAELTSECQAKLRETIRNRLELEQWLNRVKASEAAVKYFSDTELDIKAEAISMCVSMNILELNRFELWFWASPSEIREETTVEAEAYYNSLLPKIN